MAGYWPSSFFCRFMDRDEVEVHKNAKNERDRYSAILTAQAWSIKDLYIWPKDSTKEFRFCGNKAGNPERAR